LTLTEPSLAMGSARRMIDVMAVVITLVPMR